MRYLPRPGWAAPGSQASGAAQEDDEVPFGLVEPYNLADPVEFAGWQPGEDFDGGAFDEALGFGPVFEGGQRVQVGQRVGDHERGHAFGPVESGQRVGVFDQAGRAAQCTPQFVHDGQVVVTAGVAVLGEGGGASTRA